MIYFVPAGTVVEASSDSYQLSPVEEQVRELELLAVKTAEAHQFQEALELLNQGVFRAPEYASVYNNRAQVNSLSPFPCCLPGTCVGNCISVLCTVVLSLSFH